MKKLLRSQMKNVMGGLDSTFDDEVFGNCTCDKGTASKGDSCYITTERCAKKCKCGHKCVDQGNELGSKCN
jgi:hypothetical protein